MDLLRSTRFHSLACALVIYGALTIGIDGASPLKARSAAPLTDQCFPNPCYNRAICRSRGDGYSCFCVPGFQGERCQIEVNECVSQPCRNRATCVDRVGRYACLCSPGFTGATCEVQINECQSQPCLNGGSCHDYVNGFSCTCMPGFQGDRCEIDVDECQHQPCQNGALCIDRLNGYSCDCSQTTFTGRHCETAAPPCTSQPCLNSAICVEDKGNYTCDCWPGFKGRQCEVDVSECSSNPCLYRGRCIELSWQSLYGSESLLPDHYDPQQAAGFICSCPPGTTGTLCEEVVDACDPSPCENGGQCESLVESYVCHCSPQNHDEFLYGGQNCSEAMVGCEGHECQNQGSCSPFLSDGHHGYSCLCPPGLTGPLCQTPTAFSFERKGYLLLQSPLVAAEASCNITLSFRTVLPRAVLFQRGSGGLVLGLELLGGQLTLSLRREALAGGGEEGEALQLRQTLELPLNVTDGEWHSVKAVLEDGLLSLRLLDGGVCQEQDCESEARVDGTLAGADFPESPLQNTFIGGVVEAGAALVPVPAFIGCLRDVFVDSQLVVPEEWLSDSAVNVTAGCSHRDRCQDSPCENRGQCINLWQSYQCRCPRPYEGHDCAEEYVAARFGNKDSQSYAVFTITDNPGSDITVSLFLRTRRHAGLLLVLVNSTSQYLRLWLDKGRVRVQLHNFETLTSESAVNDGDIHFVSMVVDREHMVLYVANQKQGSVEVRTVDSQMGDVVYVGGLAEQKASAAFGGYFKGCIQDLRINGERLQFFRLDTPVTSYPVELMANVIAGCTGDDSCSRNPCQNGGMCYSMWDDFTCTCPPNTAGRRCEEVKWCELSPCPARAECHILSQGYECFSNATFLDDSSVLSYRGNGRIQRSLASISLSMRTRKRHAAILHAESGPEFVTVSVQDGLLFLELQSGVWEGSSTVSLSSRRRVSDGEWHSVHLFMVTPWAEASRWTMVLDEEAEEAGTSSSEGGNLDFLREEVDILLGGLGPEAGWSLVGCLGTVEVGGIALPYYSPSEVNLPRTQEEQFLRTSPSPPRGGCSGGPVCQPSPCVNRGSCQDLWNLFNCSCDEGWAGRRCELNTDTCASNPCIHGNCSVQGLAYKCSCEFGYTGMNCEEEVDVCENHLCAHGGTCLHGVNKYACLCAENYTGPYCNDRVEEIPWYIVVNRNGRPKLPVSVCGDETRNYTCFNAGNCTERELSCDCLPGFTGHRCEQEVDECKSNPCLNGGYCRNLINKYHCVCDMSFAGDNCQIDLTSEGLTADLLLSVSLVSVVLLLALVSISVGLVVALNRRATHGTYSPSRQEKEGSRVEMWNIAQPPPVERLI
ncbi:protein crumbs homolog 1 [Salvelinus alpinus]|uniref:protein crumbs homolog 1 n=1 Tax=Salvelinus alpinus TaxID=8036 RepID=UPI0039FC7104